MQKYEVDIDLANAAKKEMGEAIDMHNPRLLNKTGAFSALYDFSFPEYREPVLVLKTEEPGSKQLIAAKEDRIEDVCYDMINHLVNDCIVMGARPLSIQDAIICGKLEKPIVTRIVRAIAEACRAQDCVLTGGETSEQPGVLAAGSYILTSSIVGIAEKSLIIDGRAICAGHTVLALESSGVHTNGYTLVRRLMSEYPEILSETIDGESFMDAILKHHRCYYQQLKGLFGTGKVSGLAHITGGGICENLDRILPADLNADIDLCAYRVPKIFGLIKKYGEISDAEMLRTFNLGVGLAAVVPAEHAAEVIDHIERLGVPCYAIGRIVPGTKRVTVSGNISY